MLFPFFQGDNAAPAQITHPFQGSELCGGLKLASEAAAQEP